MLGTNNRRREDEPSGDTSNSNQRQAYRPVRRVDIRGLRICHALLRFDFRVRAHAADYVTTLIGDWFLAVGPMLGSAA